MADDINREIDRVNQLIIEENNGRRAALSPNTFSILYREGAESSDIEYSDYFLEELENRSKNTNILADSEINLRTSNYTYDLYLESRLLSKPNETRSDLRKILVPETNARKISELTRRKNQLQDELNTINNELNSIVNNEPYTSEHRDEGKLRVLENVPNYFKDSFMIINYPKWGEVIEFDYDKLKAEMLDEYMRTGSKGALEDSYKNLLQHMEKFPNLYKIRNFRILKIAEDMPYEIMEKNRREREYRFQLLESAEFQDILIKINDLREARPIPPENATRQQIQEWRSTVLNEWEVLAKELWDTIPEKYKIAFNMSLSSSGIYLVIF